MLVLIALGGKSDPEVLGRIDKRQV